MTRVVSLFILVALLSAQTVRTVTVTDITGDSATHQLQTSGTARWVQLSAPSGNGSAVRIGDASTGSSQGTAMVPGAAFMYPPIPADNDRGASSEHLYDLSSIYYYAATGDKVTVQWSK